MEKKPVIEITIHTIMNRFNLTIKEVSDQFNIPYRTVQNWAGGVSTPSSYILIMMYNILDLKANLALSNIIISELEHKVDKASVYLHDDRPAEAMSILDN